MNLQKRIDLLIRLGEYILENNESWKQAKEEAERFNSWFIPEFIDQASVNIAEQYLQPEKLISFAQAYSIPENPFSPKTVGLVMAGNIPLVGFHDWMCIFLSGHKAFIKTSSKDEILINHLLEQLFTWNAECQEQSTFGGMLKGADAYIATGSNNSARYFEYYFNKYPNIIRRNRTSVAIVTGNESGNDLEKLSDDVHLYFGLGCRNVTKIYVPEGYDFVPLLTSFNRYAYFIDHYKYKNNYDYLLAIHLLNHKYYMTNGELLLSENSSVFSPISQLNYEFYAGIEQLTNNLEINQDIQCVIGEGYVPFGTSQRPSLTDYADGIDTMKFLLQL
ncbi:MAG: acyl-CoA reductase [Chitinophagaceae bacterium]